MTDQNEVDLASLEPHQAQALRDRYGAALSRPWFAIAAADLILLIVIVHMVVSRGGRVDDQFGRHFAGAGLAFLVASITGLAQTRARWPALIIGVLFAPMGLRMWVSLSHARTPVASVLDVVTLLAFAVVIIGIAYGLVGDRPRPPWREAQLPRASAR